MSLTVRIHLTNMTHLVSKKTDGVVTRFYWDGDALLGDVTGDDIREWVYYPGSFEPLAMLVTDTTCKDNEAPERIYYYANDPNGCPTRLLDESGKVVWAARYEAWGKVKKLSVNEVDQPLRLQGQYFDAETGLHYNRFRYYEPRIGSFISKDPLGIAPGINVYAFGPNTQKWIDPLGLCKKQSKPDFYVGPNGDALPSTAYRYMDSKWASSVMASKEARLSYFGFNKYNTGAEARDGFQIFYEPGNPDSWSDARLEGKFDTLQLFDKSGNPLVRVPMEYGDTGTIPEPITRCYPQFGKGGAVQLVPKDKMMNVKFDSVTLLPEN